IKKPRPLPAGFAGDALRFSISVHKVPASRLLGCRQPAQQSKRHSRSWNRYPMLAVMMSRMASFRVWDD
ncbi:hypothetical protein, partial [Escherichia coli]|uniref:hypothetical protein n=1 Tax=Escherichia coli TaxID=562 RepID=UPI001952C7C7